MPDATLALGAAVIKTFLRIWLKDNSAAEQTGLTLTDLISTKLTDMREQRKVKRLFENLEEKVADQVLKSMEHEYRDVPSNEKEAAIYAATLAFNDTRLSMADILAGDFDSLYLERMVRHSSAVATRDLGAGAIQLYDRIIAQCCSYVVEVSNVLPGFEVGVFSVILSRETELLNRITELLNRVVALSGGDENDRFENAYRQIVAKKLDHLELFGVTISDAIRTYPLSTAYISLTVNSEKIANRQPKEQKLFLGELGSDLHALDKQNLSIEEALTSTRRLFLRGEAGAGKTTLLQWVAVRASLRDFEQPLTDWNNLIPFLVRLRMYAGRELPSPEKFLSDIGRHIAEEMPSGWVQEKLRNGQAVVLVDGIDELPEAERPIARTWLRDLLDSFPDSRFIVTSRPAAVTEAWLDREEFDPAEIQPMNWSDVRTLVEQWHAAFLGTTRDQEERAVIQESQRRLLGELTTHRHLMQLATNPLLSALLCALNLDRRTFLPRDRMDVYRVALEMLLERRDVERRISSEVELSRRDKMLLLEDLAYWLIRNGWSDAPFDRVTERFDQRLNSMPQAHLSGREAASFLLDRSGIIRQPVVDRVDFIHRTFEEYLAAAAAVDADDIGLLVGHSHDDQWREVIIMAAGHALYHQRNELFEKLLDRAEQEPKYSHPIQALTIACLETAHRLDPDVLGRVETVASHLLPPRTMANAEALALGGDFIIDRLVNLQIRSARQAAATVRLATAVGGDKALELIKRCAFVGAKAVDRELVRAWPHFDPYAYGRTVLAEVPIENITISDPALLPALHYPRIMSLELDFKHGHGDIRDLARLTGVERLTISDPLLSDLSPLAEMSALDQLDLDITGGIFIRHLPSQLTVLELMQYENVLDPQVLSEYDNLKKLQVGSSLSSPPEIVESITSCLAMSRARLERFGVWDATGTDNLSSLTSVPALDSLGFLLLGRALDLRSIAGIEKWSETLTGIVLNARFLNDAENLAALRRLNFINLATTPIHDIGFMSQLSHLWVLHLGGSTEELPNLAPLRDLGKLQYLYLYGSDDVDLTPLAGMEGLQINIANLKSRYILGASKLGKGSKIQSYQ